MASVELTHISKRYGSGPHSHLALDDVSLHLDDGEFMALLGPSGSGKTTLLRTISGLETIDGGTISIDGNVVSSANLHLNAEHRQVAVVFQSHALWPHMTVADNIAFPLRQGSMSSTQIHHRVQSALTSVELADLGHRHPEHLSGGQKQRVSLARAMVGNPRALLFDEPLASLDVTLRREMMRHIAKARSTRTTMVYVTHNQEEALALADRIAVLNNGRIEQLASPKTLYREPASTMVASFVGSGNVMRAKVIKPLSEREVRLEINGHQFTARCDRAPASNTVLVSISPNDVSLADSALVPGVSALQTQADYVFYQGDEFRVETGLTRHDGLSFTCNLPFSVHPRAGDSLRLQIHDAWVLPKQEPAGITG